MKKNPASTKTRESGFGIRLCKTPEYILYVHNMCYPVPALLAFGIATAIAIYMVVIIVVVVNITHTHTHTLFLSQYIFWYDEHI